MREFGRGVCEGVGTELQWLAVPDVEDAFATAVMHERMPEFRKRNFYIFHEYDFN